MDDETRTRAAELIDLMNRSDCKGTYETQGSIDDVTYDVVWKKSEIATFGIGFYWHGGDDVVYEKYCHDGNVLWDVRFDLSTNTNEDLLKWIEEVNVDDYVIIWTGIFGKKHEKLVHGKEAAKYKSNPKYTILKF